MRPDMTFVAAAGRICGLAGFLLGLGALAMVGCGRDDESTEKPNRPPRVNRIMLVPSHAFPGDTVRAIIEISDPDLETVTSEFKWFVNDEIIFGALEPVLDTSRLHPGDEISLRAQAVDARGLTSEWIWSAVLELENPPEPVLMLKGVKLEPERIYAFTKVHAAVDYGEHEPQDFYEVHYQWLINGEPLALSNLLGSTLDPQYFKRGDKLQVWVATDDSFQGPGVRKSKILEVINLSPDLKSLPPMVEEGDYYFFRPAVKDPEGDPVIFELKEAPPGTRMDPETGEISIYRPDLNPGTHKITFTGRDGFGGEMRYTLTLTINAPSRGPGP